MPDVSVQRTIAAEPAAVWALVSDPTRYGDWSPENRGAVWKGDATGPKVGAKFRGKNKNGWARWGTTCTVTECEVNERFTFLVTSGPIKVSTWGYGLRPVDVDGETHTEVTEHTTNHENKFLEKSGSFLIGLNDRREFNKSSIEATLAAIAAELER